jgi:Na+-translocating ferredoxin:NAD+ oxidoreductase RnfG subunit
LSLTAAVVLALGGVALPAHAAVYWTPTALLGDYFKTAQKVSPRKITLSDAAAADIAGQLGVKPEGFKKTWSIYVGEADGRPTGYAILDAEIGLHEPIDFGVRFDEKGAVSRLEIMEYREPYGDQVRGARFRDQFVGKRASDPIAAGRDIAIVSGASISSKSIAYGVKRDALVLQAALKNGL